ncbi:MAG TPA: thioredoxin [Bosea sp. (in: a-proteobacteria)]|jgi:putative thioredoxin|uniref:thioredoxin n=1 Tax=Bosea sp. (in: a-proteobacteria) TaxID=1871050 RepID=UPI002E0EE14C|nr:thioredoxin [Bosea sp. (in: a-proteobacteria)]
MLVNGEAAEQPGLIKDTTTQGFRQDVVAESMKQPVLVDFWAPWCGPCKQLTPVIEKVVKEARGKVRLVKMNIDDFPEIPGQLGIQSIPAVIAFKQGQPVDGFMGAQPESQVKAFIEKLVGPMGPGATEELITAAQAAAEAGDAGGASELYAHVLELEPENLAAIAGLARLHLDMGDIEGAAGILGMVPEAKAADPIVAAVRAAIELAQQAASLGDTAELEAKVAANPKDHQARFDLALALNARDRREEAVDHLIAIIKADRKWNEDGARKQLLQFFEAWGPMDEHSTAGRRKLSTLLFS